jgi:hypothetical protein
MSKQLGLRVTAFDPGMVAVGDVDETAIGRGELMGGVGLLSNVSRAKARFRRPGRAADGEVGSAVRAALA